MNSVPAADAVDRGKSQSSAAVQDQEKSKRVDNAVHFLQDRRVRLTPLTGKVQFLRSKGLSAEEMHEAFDKIGQPQSLNDIQKIMERLPFSVVPGPTTRDTSQSLNSRCASGEVGYSAQQMPFQTYNTGRLYPPEPPRHRRAYEDAREWDWRDYVIAAGAAIISGFSAFKLFQIYSPYEIVRKDEKHVDKMMFKSESSRRRNKRDPRRITSDSDGERRGLHTLLPIPVPNAQETTKKSDQEEITRLREELKETQEALEKEKKSKAELSVNLGKLRAQTQQQSMNKDRQEAKIKSLQEEIDRLQNEAECQKTTLGEVSAEMLTSSQTTENVVPDIAQIPPLTSTEFAVPDAVMPAEALSSKLPVLNASEFSPEPQED